MRRNAVKKEKIYKDFLDKLNSIWDKCALSKRISEQKLKDKEKP